VGVGWRWVFPGGGLGRLLHIAQSYEPQMINGLESFPAFPSGS